MATPRIPRCVLFALTAALVLPAMAQTPASPPDIPGLGHLSSSWLPGNRSYLGLNLGRSTQQTPCSSSTSLFCDDKDRSMRLYAGSMVGKFWGVELGYLDTGRATLPGSSAPAQGLNLSLVGKAPLSRAIGVYGRFGTTLGRPDTTVLGAAGAPAGPERGFGLSYGAGVSLAFTPRLSATLEWESNDFRFAGSLGDPVRSTSLGLRYRY